MNNREHFHRARRRARQRPGIVLVLVVVLLVLLAIMGTAYLAVSRLDRQGIVGRGALPGKTTPTLADPALLEQLSAGAERAIKNEIIRDLFNVQSQLVPIAGQTVAPVETNISDPLDVMRGTSRNATSLAVTRFRQLANVDENGDGIIRPDTPPFVSYGENDGVFEQFYENYDAPGRADPFLASLLPERRVIDGDPRVVWPWISGLVFSNLSDTAQPEPFFSDPRAITSAGVFQPGLTYGSPRYGSNAANMLVPAGPYLEDIDDGDSSTDILNERRDVIVNAQPMRRRDSNISRSDNTRVYPSLGVMRDATDPANRTFFIGGDADGDGIADSGLIPIAIDKSVEGIDRYVDRKNGVVYFMAYRVVDNSAQINANTALSVKGDFANLAVRRNADESFTANNELRNIVRVNAVDSPNLGFFRSNVGLIDLFQESLRLAGNGNLYDNDATLLGTTMRAMYVEARNLVDARFPIGATSDPDLGINDNNVVNLLPRDASIYPIFGQYATALRNTQVDPTAPVAPVPMQFRTFGDLLENQVARRTASAGTVLWQDTPGAFKVRADGVKILPNSDAASLAARGGTLINPLLPAGDAENALLLSSRMAAPNFSTGSNLNWTYFPPTEFETWFSWTKYFDLDQTDADGDIAVLDGTAAERAFVFSQPASTGLADTTLPRSIRSLLTTRNGVTALMPERFDFEVEDLTDPVLNTRTVLPAGMLSYATTPARKVAAATGTKEELWRAFWSAMTQNSRLVELDTDDTLDSTFTVDGRAAWVAEREDAAAGTYNYETAYSYDAFKSPDRHPSAVQVRGAEDEGHVTPGTQYNRLTERQMTLIRSAIAACNTIDLRDNDQDITAMTVDLGPAAAGSTTSRVMARVYGNEKQLVITGMVIDDEDATTPTGDLVLPTICVEIYNPSNEQIDLSAYFLASMDRTAAAGGGVTMATGAGGDLVEQSVAAPAVRLDALAGTLTIDPGDYLILSNVPLAVAQARDLIIPAVEITPPTASQATPSPGEHTVLDSASASGAAISAVLNDSILPNRELALFRTRRADGQFYEETPDVATDANGNTYHRPYFSESADVSTLVPVDAVDTRSLTLVEPAATIPPTLRYYYLRQTSLQSALAPVAEAWKCFYAGRFYQVRYDDLTAPGSAGAPAPADPNPVLPATTDYAWSRYAGAAVPALGTSPQLGEPHLGPATGAANPAIPEPIRAPTIPLQNFKPATTYAPPAAYVPGAVDHPPFRFPYGSPFARNGDLLSVPFIGSYKIYRIAITGNADALDPADRTIAGAGTGNPELYEYVPITMDAVNVAPNPDFCFNDPSVGRFDGRARDVANGRLYANLWAADLNDYVVARQSPSDFKFPDVPSVSLQTALADRMNDPTIPLTDQDGPVKGEEAAANLTENVPWIHWTYLAANPVTPPPTTPIVTRTSDVVDSKSTLIPGLVNLNTAPPVVLRMLPWHLDPTTGLVNHASVLQKTRVTTLDKLRLDHTLATPAGLENAPRLTPPFGFESLSSIAAVTATEVTDAATAAARDQRMLLGMLNPDYRPLVVNDVTAQNANLTRISNLATTRSDVFTVYVTVQAWTYVENTPGANQVEDTRLVGEKRSAFIVDRSGITPTNFDPKDLIIFPIEKE